MSSKIKKLLISQPAPSAGKSPYFSLAEQHGFELDFKPFFSLETVGTREFRDMKIDIMAHSAIIFTSRTAIDHFFRLCKELRISMPDDMKYFCSSPAVAFYLQNYINYRKRKVFYAANGRTQEFHAVLLKHNKERYLIPGIEGSKESLVQVLSAKKIEHTNCVIYRSVPNEFTKEELDAYNMIIFFSPNGVDSLKVNYPDYEQGKQKIGCFGKSTASRLEELGIEINVFAPSPEFPSMTAALEDYLKKR